MKRSEAFPSKFLSKDDVEQPLAATIATVVNEELESEDGKKQKPIMYFLEDSIKPMVLNNVNWMTFEDAYGEDSETWPGGKVELYHDPSVMFGNKRVGGVRVRVPAKTKGNAKPKVTGFIQNGEEWRHAIDWCVADGLFIANDDRNGFRLKAILEKAGYTAFTQFTEETQRIIRAHYAEKADKMATANVPAENV